MGEKDIKQTIMPGFEISEKSENILPRYKQKPLLPLKSPELPPQTPNSVSELIDLIQTKPGHAENENKQESFKVKRMDQKRWINFGSEEIGKATIFFMFLTDKQYSDVGDDGYHVAEMEEISKELYPPNREVAENILEQVGVYLFSEYPHKATDRDLEYREIQEGINYCLDEKNRLTIKAMVQKNRGYELPESLRD